MYNDRKPKRSLFEEALLLTETTDLENQGMTIHNTKNIKI
jgi:hypothetical protein